jgi:signal transduction histidine kinase
VFKLSGFALIMLWASLAFSQEARHVALTNGSLQVYSVMVDGRDLSAQGKREIKLDPYPERVTFGFGPATNSTWVPIRLTFKLEGYDPVWRRGRSSAMTFKVSFYNDSLDIVDQHVFTVEKDSTGWNGSLKTSTLTHRRETILVPPRATRVELVLSSAGPPSAVGVYVVDGLEVSHVTTNGTPQILLGNPFDADSDTNLDQAPKDWQRDGTGPSMAKVVEIGQDPQKKALAILDEDPIGHAEWHNKLATAPRVRPGELLVVEWNELFSIGLADTRVAEYQNLPPGNYRFLVKEETIFGVPTGVETSVDVVVPLPIWKQAKFWLIVVTILIAAAAAGVRYHASHKLKREVSRLKEQRALEQERLRIARDIHDDLGARVTQISMLSAMAPGQMNFPQNAAENFHQISQMSRDLVSALYETVWAVNPENDNLYAVGNYLRQMTSQLCEPAQLRCRFQIPMLPRDVEVSSQTRHNLAMAVKEAVHNIMKHASATELTIRVVFSEMLLAISIQDNGCGFQISGMAGGNGLANMKRRMADLGGTCVVESQPGSGTSVHLRLKIKVAETNSARDVVPDTMNIEAGREQSKS